MDHPMDGWRSLFSTPACSSSLASPGSCVSYCISLLILKSKKQQQKMIQKNIQI
ncbi:SPX domain-containing membrane protein [Zea mays]|uniref:SPX domain-containing membrane protein n=1 Tax=Zea mays TaxID=4577 RepID=A0A1D6E283_MAIZE|nr:SPX domain-containing membrane protein [Zea mays]